MTSFEHQEALSAPLSPNRVRKGHSQDMPAEGSIFDVSPEVIVIVFISNYTFCLQYVTVTIIKLKYNMMYNCGYELRYMYL